MIEFKIPDEGTVNVIRVSLSMMVLFTAILSQEFIQEVVIVGLSDARIGGIEKTDGYMSLCVIYFFNTISCPFAPAIVNRISGKWAMVIAMCLDMFLQISFLYPHRILLYLAAVLTGIGTTLLWVGQGQYITQNVSKNNIEKNTAVQWAMFKISLIIGGTFFLVFFQNKELHDIVKNGMMSSFMYVFIGCSIVALLNTIFLPQTKTATNSNATVKSFKEATRETLQLLMTLKMFFLSIFFIYTGFIRSFWISIFPSCIKFTTVLATNTTTAMSIGMLVTGVGQVLGSFLVTLIGKRIRKFGQHFLVFFSVLLHCALFVLIGLSFPDEAPREQTFKDGPVLHANMPVAMVTCGLLGFGDAILQTQVYAYIAQDYPKQSSAAFAIFRFFSGIATTGMFFAARFFLLTHHLILLGVSALFASGAVIVFHYLKKASTNQQQASTIAVPIFHKSVTSH